MYAAYSSQHMGGYGDVYVLLHVGTVQYILYVPLAVEEMTIHQEYLLLFILNWSISPQSNPWQQWHSYNQAFQSLGPGITLLVMLHCYVALTVDMTL